MLAPDSPKMLLGPNDILCASDMLPLEVCNVRITFSPMCQLYTREEFLVGEAEILGLCC